MKLRAYIVSLLVALATMSVAAPRYSTGGVSHWLGISLTGVEATPILDKKTDAYAKAGGGGQLTLLYELHKGHFFFNAGLGADYIVTNCALDAYHDEFPRVDFTGEPVLYRYVYSDLKEQQTQVRILLPVQFGYRFGRWVYAGLGATVRFQPIMNKTVTTVRMFTEGEYERFIQPIRNAPAYDYRAEAEYKGNSLVRSATNEVALEAEVGARIPLKAVQMRIGAYVGYDLPLQSYNAKRANMTLIDYTEDPKIRFNSLLDSPVLNKDAQRVRAGLRVTFLFNVTRKTSSCMCMND